jgi:hypothetical protein
MAVCVTSTLLRGCKYGAIWAFCRCFKQLGQGFALRTCRQILRALGRTVRSGYALSESGDCENSQVWPYRPDPASIAAWLDTPGGLQTPPLNARAAGGTGQRLKLQVVSKEIQSATAGAADQRIPGCSLCPNRTYQSGAVTVGTRRILRLRR